MEGVVAGAEVFRNFDRRFSLGPRPQPYAARDSRACRRGDNAAASNGAFYRLRGSCGRGYARRGVRTGERFPEDVGNRRRTTFPQRRYDFRRAGGSLRRVRPFRAGVAAGGAAPAKDGAFAAGAARPPCRPMRFCPRIDRRPIRRKSLRPRRMLRIVWPRSFTAITGCGKLHADSIWNLRRQGIRSCVRPIAFGVRSDSA